MSLSYLFADDAKIFICNFDAENGTKHEFVGNVYEVTNELVKRPRNFFCINEVKGQRRLKNEIRTYTNFLIEDDNTPIDVQMRLLPTIMELGIVRTATFSGSKSIHYVVSCMDDLTLGEPGGEQANERYKNIWLGLQNIFTNAGLTVDPSNKNPVVLSRLPGILRGETEQKLLDTGKLVDAAFLHSIAVQTARVPRLSAENLATNFNELNNRLNLPEHSRLAGYIKFPGWISQSAGNYPMLLRLTLWAIDEVGATPDTFIPYLEKHLVQHLQAKNYFKDWKVAVEHGFRMKGML